MRGFGQARLSSRHVAHRIQRKCPSGLIHDWIGAAFIPRVTLNDVMAVARDYARYKEVYQPTVVDSKAIATGETKDRYSMLLMNKSLFLKTAFDSDYESCYVHVDDRRAYSVTRTTRVQEIEEYGSPAQRLLHEGEGSGVIWRLFGITRYVERDGGVYVELEAIGLSRDIPASLRWLVEPIVRRVSRASLSTSLRQTENAVRLHAEVAHGKPGSGGSIVATPREVQGLVEICTPLTRLAEAAAFSMRSERGRAEDSDWSSYRKPLHDAARSFERSTMHPPKTGQSIRYSKCAPVRGWTGRIWCAR